MCFTLQTDSITKTVITECKVEETSVGIGRIFITVGTKISLEKSPREQ